MAGMSRKEIARLLDHIEPQGVTTTRTTKGVLLRLPDQSTTMLHFTGSDVREAKNVRARLKRAGVSWPTDGEPLGDRIITSRPQKRTLALATEALSRWEGRSITGAQLRRLLPEGESMTVHTSQVALWHLGWTPTGPATSRKWLRPLADEPEPEHLLTNAELAARELAHLPQPEPQPEPTEAPQLALVPDDVPEAPAGGLREFIDTADSWTASPAALPPELTVTQLAQVLAAFGLQSEIRVWRGDR